MRKCNHINYFHQSILNRYNVCNRLFYCSALNLLRLCIQPAFLLTQQYSALLPTVSLYGQRFLHFCLFYRLLLWIWRWKSVSHSFHSLEWNFVKPNSEMAANLQPRKPCFQLECKNLSFESSSPWVYRPCHQTILSHLLDGLQCMYCRICV